MNRNWIIAGVAAVCFITGVALSNVIDPGVRVETIMLHWGEVVAARKSGAAVSYPQARGSKPLGDTFSITGLTTLGNVHDCGTVKRVSNIDSSAYVAFPKGKLWE
jgi:hypothetical protein